MYPSSLGDVPLSDVSSTMLLTLYCHARASLASHPLIDDPESVRIWQTLRPELEGSSDALVKRLLGGSLPELAVGYISTRARRFDRYVADFLRQEPDGVVVSLGCGLDPRFARIDNGLVRFFDLDLPEVIGLKRRFLTETDRYRMIPDSATGSGWLDQFPGVPGTQVLFLAEGLFMYLPEDEVKALVLRLQARFPGCELVCEMFNRRWLDPKVAWIVRAKLRSQLGFGPDATFRFGIRKRDELEQWGPGIRLLDDWSVLDEPYADIGWPTWFAGIRFFRTTQWVVHYRLG